ncbi:(S)-benzoin forming benzil reductase [Virgibacillus alimentarius]|uniref:Benzil reductase ((S)-benzoin forming) n=1 Tax=Virgibacillus alimentarius TaxID=698769 RepID=A0ABS4S7A0_9BACI|nr:MULTISPECIES: (S)-benzoin forming benzil reductase [Virgibacillus]MBP2257368.1 benzil reductase ((S)-benzoin forming) [Virgibacillus alimentarius]HLR68609.1 (S)-benzoin forming benzil reductase [Virgibacillus sp.]
MKFAVVTGVSKGLGESVAKLFLEAGVNVIGISRTKNDALSQIAEQNNQLFTHYTCDLGDVASIEKAFNDISKTLYAKEPSFVYLVNNAAVVEPIDQAMNIQAEDLAYHVQVNTVAPMVLTNLFLQKSLEKDVPLISVIITSGAAERPVYGWSAYCSTKASMNMYTKTVSLEQDELKTGNKIIAFSPGVMDTAMQEQIRTSSYDEFMDVEKFKDYKKNNHLKNTETVGGVLVDILRDEATVKNGNIYYVRDYL